MDVIIELISRSKRVIERYRYAGDRVTIGRAYDNDLIISDPHLSPHHAVLIDQGEQGWRIEDLDSKNGIYTKRHQRLQGRAAVSSGDELILGKTHLRIYDRTHPVPDALSMNPVEKLIQPMSRTGNAIVLIFAALVVFAVNAYQEMYVVLEFRNLFAGTMGQGVAGLLWAVAWSFVGRVMRHDARFLLQLTISMAYLVGELIFSAFLDLLAFNSGSGAVAFILGVFGHALLFAGLLWMNLYLAVNLTDRKRWLASAGVSITAASIVLLYYLFSVQEFSPQPQYVHFLKPPILRWVSPVDVDVFLRDASVILEQTEAHIEE
jgi:hypothetical protein